MRKDFLKIISLALIVILLSFEVSAQKHTLPALSKTPAEAIKAAKFQNNYTLHFSKKQTRRLIRHPEYIHSLDSFLSDAIQKKVFPGCQVFAAVNGDVIYQKSFGHYTYDQSPAVTDSTLFDVASVTKVMATTLAVMKLVGQRKINLDSSLRTYLPHLVVGTNKQNIKIRDLLMHQAGLVAWLPFYRKTLDSVTHRPRADIYKETAEKGFTIPVAANLFMKNTYIDTMWKEILESPLTNLGRYVYSDLDFYFLQRVVEKVSGEGLSDYVQQNLYRPLGLKDILYNPWKAKRINECAPTEDDHYFRYQLLQGYVHDQGAAMLGGVAGHAGIFASAKDLGVILQMLLNGGIYRKHQYFDRQLVRYFTEYHSTLSRRGLGFDKPIKENEYGGPAAQLCSKSTFGHQGFTGTCVWADPESGIVFVLLSNRVYPSAENEKIVQLNIRTIAQEYIYKALGYHL